MQSSRFYVLYNAILCSLIFLTLIILTGECLADLADTSDTNAVLVLQPAVEAFFLVHGSDKDEIQDKDKRTDVTEGSSSASLDLPPFSPGPLSPTRPVSPSRQSSVSSIPSDLPPDTQKFLRFAGMWCNFCIYYSAVFSSQPSSTIFRYKVTLFQTLFSHIVFVETHRIVLNQILRQSTTPLSDGPFAVLVYHTRLLDFDVKRRYFRQELEKLDKVRFSGVASKH